MQAKEMVVINRLKSLIVELEKIDFRMSVNLKMQMLERAGGQLKMKQADNMGK